LNSYRFETLKKKQKGVGEREIGEKKGRESRQQRRGKKRTTDLRGKRAKLEPSGNKEKGRAVKRY